jgi:YHS domain-containing protein
LLFGSCLSATFAQDVSLRKKEYNLDDGVAISGYDPVAYFTMHKAVKGSKDNAVVDQGVTYYFASPADVGEFKKDPAKYEPAYGGWCAYAMGNSGEKVSVDPKTFKLVDGKLNLFYNKFFSNTLTSWNKDEPNLKKKADSNWAKIIH